MLDVLPFVRYNKVVEKINYNNNPIQIECADGTTYTAEHLICTVSLGVLKERHFSLFDPILPHSKVRTIEGLSFGSVAKVYLEYEKPFWPADFKGHVFLWKHEQLKIVREDPVNGEWLEGLCGFFPVHRQPNILIGWMTGPEARKMEYVSEADVKAGAEKVIGMFLKQWNPSSAKACVRYDFIWNFQRNMEIIDFVDKKNNLFENFGFCCCLGSDRNGIQIHISVALIQVIH